MNKQIKLFIAVFVVAIGSMCFSNIDTKAVETQPTGDVIRGIALRDAFYDMKEVSPMEATTDDVDPLTGNLIITRNDISLPGINGLNFSLDRFYSPTNVYMGEDNINRQPLVENGVTVIDVYFSGYLYGTFLASDYARIAYSDSNINYHRVNGTLVEMTRNVSFINEEKLTGYYNYNAPYSAGANWSFDFPWVETMRGQGYYLHLGSKGTWKINCENVNYQTYKLVDYPDQDVTFNGITGSMNGGTIFGKDYKYVMKEKNGINTYFNSDGLVIYVVNQFNQKITFEYDSNNQLNKITDSVGREIRFAYTNKYIGVESLTVSVKGNSAVPSDGGVNEKVIDYEMEKYKAGDFTNYKLVKVSTGEDRCEEYEYDLKTISYNTSGKNPWSGKTLKSQYLTSTQENEQAKKIYNYESSVKNCGIDGAMDFYKVNETYDQAPYTSTKSNCEKYHYNTVSTQEYDGYPNYYSKAAMPDTFKKEIALNDKSTFSKQNDKEYEIKTFDKNKLCVKTLNVGESISETVNKYSGTLVTKEVTKEYDTVKYSPNSENNPCKRSVVNYKYDTYRNVEEEWSALAKRDTNDDPEDTENNKKYKTTYKYFAISGVKAFDILNTKSYYRDDSHIITEKNTLTKDNLNIAKKETIENGVTKDVTNYEYNTNGTLKTVKTPLDGVENIDYMQTDYAYDSHGNVIKEQTKGANLIKYDNAVIPDKTCEFDFMGNLLKSSDGAINVKYAYDKNALVKSQKTEAINTAQTKDQVLPKTEMDNQITVEESTDVCGHKMYKKYDAYGNIVISSDGHENKITFTDYDSKSRTVRIAVYVGQYSAGKRESDFAKHISTEISKYDDKKNVETEHITLGGNNDCTSWKKFDSVDKNDSKLGFLNISTVITLDPKKHPNNAERIKEDSTSSISDSTGNVIKSIHKTEKYVDGKALYTEKEEIHTYDLIGNMIETVSKSTNNKGTITFSITSEYDYAGNCIKTTNADKKSASTGYNACGWTMSQTDYKGNTSANRYDILGRVKKTETPILPNQSSVIEYQYDDKGNMTSQREYIDSSNYKEVKYEYDLNSRLVMVINSADGSNKIYTQYLYDADGNKIRMFTGMDDKLSIQIEENQNPITSTTFGGNGAKTIKESYKVNKNYQITVTEPNAQEYQTTKYTYDSSNKLIGVESPDKKVVRYTYDDKDLLLNTTDKNGNTLVNTYDNQSRIEKTISTNTETQKKIIHEYDYNSLGELYKKDNTGFTYDENGQLLTETENVDGNEIIKDYSYNPDGSRNNFTVNIKGSEKLNLTYDYDVLGRMTDVKENGILTAHYGYDANGNRLNVQYENGIIKTDYFYNWANQVREIFNKSNNNLISEYGYDHNRDGSQRMKIDAVKNETTNFTYDKMGRLTEEVSPTNNIAYEYDSYNNRKGMIVNGQKTTYNYNSSGTLLDNTVTGAEKNIYSYDYNGNQLAVAKQKIELYTQKPETKYSIGIRGTNTGSENVVNSYDSYDQLVRSSNKKMAAEYEYNESGLRTKKSVSGHVTRYVWDNDQIVFELDNSLNVQKKYVRGINLIYAVDGKGNNKVFYVYNGHGDVVQLVDISGNVAKEYEYDSFGNEVNPVSSDDNPFRYCGEYYDKETETVYLRARYYDPEIGRFITEDSYTGNEKDPLSLNLYTYCHNDSVNATDPSGHERIVVSGGIFDKTKKWYFEFISSALLYMKSASGKKFNTWLIADNGWSSQDKADIKAAKDKHIPDVKIIWIEGRDYLINYINKKSGGNNHWKKPQVSKKRKKDPVVDFTVFSHAYADKLALGYDHKLNHDYLSIEKKHISLFGKGAFNKYQFSMFYSCNTGNGGSNSFAQKWVNQVGGLANAFTGRTDYTGIMNKKAFEDRVPVARSMPVGSPGSVNTAFKPK